MNNESLELCEYKTKKHDLNNYLLTRSLFTKTTLNDDYEKLYSCFLTRIKIIITTCFIMSDNRSIINLLSYLIIAFNFFCEKRDDFEFKKNSSL